jgi:hypothetical protein
MRTPSLNFYAPSKKKQRPEARLQKAVVQILRLDANPDVLWFSIPNEGKRSVVVGAELKAMGLRSGAADLCFIIRGRAHFLELKADDGTQSPEQVTFAADCTTSGAVYALAWTIGEALAVLTSWGVLLRVRVAA